MKKNSDLLKIANKLIPTLYDYQKEIMNYDLKKIIINKSRQVGVSYAVACWSLLNSIFNDRTELIISPSLRQSKHMMDYIYEHLNKLRDDFTVPLREETKTSILFQAGGAIHSLPNSANTVRGFKADDIYIDEFAHFTCGTDKDIIKAIAPSISRGGNITYISTPFGDQNLFYKYWNSKNIHKKEINWKDCPDFKSENIEGIKETIGGDAFEQEYNNKFLSDMEGQEFPLKLIEGCIDYDLEFNSDPALSFNKASSYVGGVDIGRKHDLTALITLEKKEGRYYANYKRTMKDAEYDEQKNFMRYILNNARFDNFWVDASGIGNDIAETLRKEFRVSSLIFNNENKQELVTNLKNMMQQGKIKFPNDTQLINSIRAIQRQYTANNFIRFDAPRDIETGHADLFFALALAVYKQNKTNRGGFKLG